MNRQAGSMAIVCLSLGLGGAAHPETPAVEARQKGAAVSRQARGTFEVKATPLPKDEKVVGLSVGRLSLDKRFGGDLEGTSKGEMMTAETSVQGSAGYVAIEHVTGTLQGRSGSFILLHQGTMRKGGEFNLTITVVPDSGTGQLTGLAGKMAIVIADGKHSYDFDYTLLDAP